MTLAPNYIHKFSILILPLPAAEAYMLKNDIYAVLYIFSSRSSFRHLCTPTIDKQSINQNVAGLNPGTPRCVSRCPWARSWTPNCSSWVVGAVHGSSAISVWMCVCMCESDECCKDHLRNQPLPVRVVNQFIDRNICLVVIQYYVAAS